MKKYIKNSWEGYKDSVVPKRAGEVQLSETRQAFYAGAAVLFQGLMLAFEEGSEPTDSDMSMMDSIQKEINEFGSNLDIKAFGNRTH